MTSVQPEPDVAEYLAAEHMRSLGFRGAKRTTTGPDGGVDVEAPTAIAQVKHLKSPVSRPAVQQLLGTGGRSISRLFYSAGGFSRPALELADAEGVALFTYDLATNQVTPVGETACRLERAADYPGSEPLEAVRPMAEEHRPAAGSRGAATARPPIATTYAVVERAVHNRLEPSELRWYFYVTCFSGGILAWVAFLHAYRESRNRHWLAWAVGSGTWGFIAVVAASALSGSGDDEAARGSDAGRLVLGLLMIAAIGVSSVWLTTARRQALGLETATPPGHWFSRQRAAYADTAPPTEPIPTRPAPQTPPAPGYFDAALPHREAVTAAPPSPAESRWEQPGLGRLIGSYIWAASPFLMVSLGTPVTFLISAIMRPRRLEMWLYLAYYLGLFVASGIMSSRDPAWVFGLLVVLEWPLATGHAFLIRRQVWYLTRRARAELASSGSP